MPKFKPGQSGNPKGKPKGARDLKHRAWDELGDYIIGDGAERYLQMIRELNDKDFSHKFETLLEFFKPKQQRTEIKGELNTGPKKIGIKKDTSNDSEG